ncbi:MAG TPA: glycosyltransferase, partial [Holophaga sp.]|nr:glycosyltransferase [Holophaga sp.]
LETARLLQGEGIPTVVASSPRSELLARARKSGLATEPFAISNLSFLNPFKLLKIRRFLKREKVTAIVLNNPSDFKAAGIAAKWAGVERIVYRKGSARKIRPTRLNRWLFGRVVTSVIANSIATRDMMLAGDPDLVPAGKIHIIYNSFDLAGYDAAPCEPVYRRQGGELILGNAGRMSVQKNQHDLLLMAARLKELDLDFKLLIAGDGKLMPELVAAVDELGLKERVVFLGFVENIRAFMESLDIFVLTSRWEGFGYVLAEAMASRKPVLAYDLSSNPEIVADQETGYLVPPFDTRALADKAALLMGDAGLRERMGQAGRARVARMFSVEAATAVLKRLV